MAVREGFEPSMPFDIHTFQACSFDHSDISPGLGLCFGGCLYCLAELRGL